MPHTIEVPGVPESHTATYIMSKQQEQRDAPAAHAPPRPRARCRALAVTHDRPTPTAQHTLQRMDPSARALARIRGLHPATSSPAGDIHEGVWRGREVEEALTGGRGRPSQPSESTVPRNP